MGVESIMIKRRIYRVEVIPAGPSALYPELPAYRLHGPRGALYFTMRNQKRRHAMFLVGRRVDPLGSVWLTDESGKLEVM